MAAKHGAAQGVGGVGPLGGARAFVLCACEWPRVRVWLCASVGALHCAAPPCEYVRPSLKSVKGPDAENALC